MWPGEGDSLFFHRRGVNRNHRGSQVARTPGLTPTPLCRLSIHIYIYIYKYIPRNRQLSPCASAWLTSTPGNREVHNPQTPTVSHIIVVMPSNARTIKHH